MGVVATALSQPPFRWQQHAYDLGGELVWHERRGIWIPAYRSVVILVARQNGKTITVLVWELDRCLNWETPQRVTYSAQTGKDAREKLLQDQVPMLERARPIWRRVTKVDRRAGEEGVLFQTGSRIGLLSSTEESGHGKTVGLGVIDEAFADEDNRRVGAIEPSMRTVPDAQLLTTSTKGTSRSLYLNEVIARGRVAAETDTGRGVCHIEYSAPRTADSDDEAAWALANPTLDETLGIDIEVLRQARATMDEAEFRRTAMNITDERAGSAVISVEAFEARCEPDVAPARPFVLGLDVTPDLTRWSLVACDSDGVAELVQQGAGSPVGFVSNLCAAVGSPVVLDETAPAGTYKTELQQAGCWVVSMGAREVAHACSALVAAVAGVEEAELQWGDGEPDEAGDKGDAPPGDTRPGVHPLTVRTDDRMQAAVAAGRRQRRSQLWIWYRGGPDITALWALTMAHRLAMQQHPGDPLVAHR